MKKLILLMFSLILVFFIIACSTDTGSEEDITNGSGNDDETGLESYTIKAGSANNEENMFTQILYRFGEIIEEKTDGRIKVDVFANAQLGTDSDQLEGMTLGSVDMVVNASALYANYDPIIGMFDIPFMFRDYDHVHSVVDGEVGSEIRQSVLEASGLRILGFPDGLFRYMYLKGDVTVAGDLVGMTIRSPEVPVYTQMISALGANPTPLPWNDIYTSLQTGLIEGAEGPIDGAYEQNFHEVIDTLLLSRHIYSPTAITIRDSLYTQFSKTDQEFIEEAARQVIEEFRLKIQDSDKKFVALFEEAGVNVVEVDNTVMMEKTEHMPEAFIEENGGEELLNQLINTQ